MRPFPPFIQTMFPAPRDRMAARPWWVQVGHNGTEPVYRRIDKMIHEGVDQPGAAKTAAQAEIIDNQDPIPRPAYRVGQIWVSADCVTAFQISQMNTRIPTMADVHGLHTYLIADLACPHLAPWAAPIK